VGEVEPERGRDVLEVGVALVADRQELEMPPPSLFSSTIVSASP
jgi:hypothetical protein